MLNKAALFFTAALLVACAQQPPQDPSSARQQRSLPVNGQGPHVLASQGGEEFHFGSREVLFPYVVRGFPASDDTTLRFREAVAKTSTNRGAPVSVATLQSAGGDTSVDFNLFGGVTGIQIHCTGACGDWWLSITRADGAGHAGAGQVRYSGGFPVVVFGIPTYHNNPIRFAMRQRPGTPGGLARFTLVRWPMQHNFREHFRSGTLVF